MSGEYAHIGNQKTSLATELYGDLATLLQSAERDLTQARETADKQACAAALVQIGGIHYRLGHYPKAAAYASQALEIVTPETSVEVDALILAGNCTFEVDKIAKVEPFLRRAADVSRQINYSRGRYRSLHNLAACVFSMAGQFELALAGGEEAYRIACELNDPQQASALIFLAHLCIQTGNLSKGKAYMDILAPLVPQDSLLQGYFFLLKAMAAELGGDSQGCYPWCVQATAIAESVGDPALNVLLRLVYSRYYQMTGNPSSAYQWADDAVTWAAKAGNHRMLGRAFTERGRSAWLNRDPAAAENDFIAAIDDLTTRGQHFDLVRAKFFLAALYNEQGEPDAQKKWLEVVELILHHGYCFLLDQERELAYPLLSAASLDDNAAIQKEITRCIEYLQQVTPPPLRVEMLGNFMIFQHSRPIKMSLLRKRRAGELLAYLVLNHNQPIFAEQVIDSLWPEKDPEHALMLFYQATSTLRRVLEPGLPQKFPSRYLNIDEGWITFRLPEGSVVDVECYEKFCEKEDWEAACQVYSGDLLLNYLYADWTVLPREKMKRLYLRALMITAHRHHSAGRHREVIELCHRMLELDPWIEEAVLLGMQAYLAKNDRAGALRLYQQLEHTLLEELNTTPQEKLSQLYRSII